MARPPRPGANKKKPSKSAVKVKNKFVHSKSKAHSKSKRSSSSGSGSGNAPTSTFGPLFSSQHPPSAQWKLPSYVAGNKSASSVSKDKRRKSMQKNRVEQNNQKRNNQRHAPRGNSSVRKFQLQLPAVMPNAPSVPWINNSNHNKSSSSSSSSSSKTTTTAATKNNKKKNPYAVSKQQLLNTITVNPKSLEQFDDELEQFARYVSLTPLECQAREYLIGNIQQLANNLFGISSNQCQIFGSFAARPVCTFESDIDMALWGVVEAEVEQEPSLPDYEEDEQQHEEEDEDEDEDNVDGAAAFFRAKPDVVRPISKIKVKSKPKKAAPKNNKKSIEKQEKVLRWKAALDEMAQEILPQEEKETKEKSKQKQQQNKQQAEVVINIESSSSSEEEEDDPLFVIDRVGEKGNDAPVVTDDSQYADASEENNSDIVDGTNKPPLPAKKNSSTQFADADENDDNVEAAGSGLVVVPTNKKNTKGTVHNPLEVPDDDSNEDSDDQASNDDDDSDDDTADKLEGLLKQSASTDTKEEDEEEDRLRLLSLPSADDMHDEQAFVSYPDVAEEKEEEEEDDDDDDDEEEVAPTNKKTKTRSRSQSVVSLCSATTCSEDEREVDESGLEVSFVTEPNTPRALSAAAARRRSASAHVVVGPTGETRSLVIRALNTLSRRLRRTPTTTQLFVRKHARVPIINLETQFGFECDIALGGHNGTDTSSYAKAQCAKFQSFATVVLVLKVILSQQGLDKPFTGGLGSFKLYVLVATHIERHLALGGFDSPAEVLFMFLFRYGDIPGFNNIQPAARTALSQLMVVESQDGGAADMGGVYQVENCILVFRACWQRLRTKLKQHSDPKNSMLCFIVDVSALQTKRKSCSRQAALVSQFETAPMRRNNNNMVHNRATPTLSPTATLPVASNTRSVSIVSNTRSHQASTERTQLDTDDEAEHLMAGYGVSSSNNKAKETKKSRKKAKTSSKKKSKEERRNKRRTPMEAKSTLKRHCFRPN